LHALQSFPQLVDEFDRDCREIIDEIERVLDLVRDPGSAITAWSAKVVTKSISRSVKGSTRLRASPMTPIGSPSRISGTPIIERPFPILASCFFS
jgi:hypothetical protein